jgi:hypothetical protein
MKLQTIEMPVEDAQKAFDEYRRVLRSAKTSQTNTEDAQIARCYKALSKGQQVIDLNDVMRRGGENSKGLPRLAISRADYEQVRLLRNWRTGHVEMYSPDIPQWRRGEYQGRLFEFPGLFTVREPGFTQLSWDRKDRVPVLKFKAVVPNIPPTLRPAHSLSNYQLLFEARWEVAQPPAPRDPALLKHLGGPLYAVLATWDLTPVEQVVLGVTRN